jgi:ABC-type nitrate/sulfonate/bicarbonate transport system substrate-binding protein
VQHGFNVVAFGLNQPKLDYVLIVNSHITSIKQLKGQSVGVLTGSPDDITWVLLKQALQSAGLDIPDVNLVTIGGQVTRVAALVSGRVAATVVSHQYLQRLAPSGFHSLADFAQRDPNVYNDIFWAPPDWLKANPKLAVAFNMAALDTYRAMDDPKTRPALIAEDVANSPGATTAQAQALFDVYVKYDMFPPNAIMTPAALTSQEKMYYSYHTIDSAPPVSRWAVTKYDEAALKVLGTVKTGNS